MALSATPTFNLKRYVPNKPEPQGQAMVEEQEYQMLVPEPQGQAMGKRISSNHITLTTFGPLTTNQNLCQCNLPSLNKVSLGLLHSFYFLIIQTTNSFFVIRQPILQLLMHQISNHLMQICLPYALFAVNYLSLQSPSNYIVGAFVLSPGYRMVTGTTDFMVSQGFKTPMEQMPTQALALPHAASRLMKTRAEATSVYPKKQLLGFTVVSLTHDQIMIQNIGVVYNKGRHCICLILKQRRILIKLKNIELESHKVQSHDLKKTRSSQPLKLKKAMADQLRGEIRLLIQKQNKAQAEASKPVEQHEGFKGKQRFMKVMLSPLAVLKKG